jgi:hypothetical protein
MAFYVIDGEHEFYADGHWLDLRAGDTVLVLAGAAHGFRAGPQGGSGLVICPGGQERWFAEVAAVGGPEAMPSKSANVKNEKQYEKLTGKGLSKSRAALIANSPGASSRGGKKPGSGSSSKQGGATAQKKAAGAKGGQAAARKK